MTDREEMVSAVAEIDLTVLRRVSQGGHPGAIRLSIALIGPEEGRRTDLAGVLATLECGTVCEMSTYPELDELPKLTEQGYEVVIVDLDTHPEYALDLVESLCGQSSATVMVYSAQADPTWMIRCMRAGAREFLTPPFTAAGLMEALIRASARQPRSHAAKKTAGVISVFFGCKGGCGVTTIACNFALLLARETNKRTLLIDLDLPLGDAALTLGITGTYSTVDALENFARLDATLMSKLLVQHSPNFFVLPSPGVILGAEASTVAVHKLLAVARQEFDYVVVDAGARLVGRSMPLFEIDAKFYMVSQVLIPDLRNANRIISEFFAAAGSKLEVVLNRYDPSAVGMDEGQITKALTRPATWKVPEDSASARKMQNAGTPIGLSDSPIAKTIAQMARSHGGLAISADKKTRFFGLLAR